MQPVRANLIRAALMLAGLLLGVVVLEIGLQAGALWMRWRGHAVPVSWLRGDRRVVCLGDSNTYGLYLRDRDDAYPQKLEALWNFDAAAPRIEVLNFGYPGTNSSRLRRDLPRILDTLRPEVVVILVGANDCWTVPVPIEEAASSMSSLTGAIRERSRVYQLMYMLGRASSDGGLEVQPGPRDTRGSTGTIRFGDETFSMGWQKGPWRNNFGLDLEANLSAIAEMTRRAGAQLVLLTYASEAANYGAANIRIRRVAERTTTPLIDVAVLFKRACPSEPCPVYLYDDHHPTARGYALVALALTRGLQQIEKRGAVGGVLQRAEEHETLPD